MESERKMDKIEEMDERDARNRELVRRYREGDEEALNLLMKENDGLLKKAFSRLKGLQEMKEDLLQEAGLEMIEAAESFDLQQNKVKFSTYVSDHAFWKMFKIADKESGGQLRRKTKKKQAENSEEEAEEKTQKVISLENEDIDSIPAAKGGNPENTVLRREYNAELEEYLNSGFLTAGEQAVIRGIVRGKENKEIGVRLYRGAWEIEKIKKRALEKVMYAEERERLFPEYAAPYPPDPSPENEGGIEYSAVLKEFLTDSGFLTAGEQAVLRGIAEGEGYDEIGARLHRKAREIEQIEKRALEKMKYARDREELFPRGYTD